MNSANPAISIVLPTYNVERYIGYCIYSIMRQTFQDFELIIVDDVSTDDTYEICQRMGSGMSRVRLLRNNTNRGAGYSRNVGLAEAKGKYIYFMDSDDELLPWALESFYRKAEEEQADVVHTNIWFSVYSEDRMMSRDFLWKGHKSVDAGAGNMQARNPIERMNYAGGNSVPMPWLNLCRRDFLKKEGIMYPEMYPGEDWLFHVEICLKAKKYVRINEMLYLYRNFFDQRKKVLKRFSRSFYCIPVLLETYNRIFASFSEAEFPCELRRVVISHFLMSHLKYSIYDVISVDDFSDFENIRRQVQKICPEGDELVAYLIYLLAKSCGISKIKEEERKKKIADAQKFFDELEHGESNFTRNYSYIYCKAKLAVHVEGAYDDFYCKAYDYLADAALELGKYQEAVDACEKAASYVLPDSAEYLRIKERAQAARRYIDYSWEELYKKDKPRWMSCIMRSSKEPADVGILPDTHVTFGAVLHYRQINDGILLLWRKIMEQIPWARILIKAEEFTEEAMMIEAGEKMAAAGIELERVQCHGIGDDYLSVYNDIDIYLGTYPVQEADRLLDALYMGVPTIVLIGPSEDAQLCRRVLDQVGFAEFAAVSREEYVSKAVDLAKNPERLRALHEELRGRLEEAAVKK